MDVNTLLGAADEQPLDRLLEGGGFCGIFRTIGCVGDSLASGEFEAMSPDGFLTYHDNFEYSWGQYIARLAGCKVYNFSRGGMTAKEYMESFAAINDFWNPEKGCQAYIVALGVNDLMGQNQTVGSAGEIDKPLAPGETSSFARYYGSILLRLKNDHPHARFFLMTMPRGVFTPEQELVADAHAQLMYDFAARLRYTYVLDFRRYAPVYDAGFREKFFLRSHMNPCGYLLTARMAVSYIDYIIRHNMKDFAQVGFIDTPFYAQET